jgi:hypothetical protein
MLGIWISLLFVSPVLPLVAAASALPIRLTRLASLSSLSDIFYASTPIRGRKLDSAGPLAGEFLRGRASATRTEHSTSPAWQRMLTDADPIGPGTILRAPLAAAHPQQCTTAPMAAGTPEKSTEHRANARTRIADLLEPFTHQKLAAAGENEWRERSNTSTIHAG